MSKAEILEFRRKHNHAAMVETIMGVRDMMRDPLPDNPPPDKKWKATTGLARLNLNGACHRVMVCLIDHANSDLAFASPPRNSLPDGREVKRGVIERAIATLRKKRLLHVVSVPCRTGKRNRYYLNWTPLFAAFKEIKAFEKAHREKRDDPTKVSGSPPNDPTKVSGYDPTKVSAEPLKKGEPLKKTEPPNTKWFTRPKASERVLWKKRKRKIRTQGRQKWKPQQQKKWPASQSLKTSPLRGSITRANSQAPNFLLIGGCQTFSIGRSSVNGRRRSGELGWRQLSYER